MARWRDQFAQDVTSFDGFRFGKYCYILSDPTPLMPFNRSHNLLVRGSNCCDGPKHFRLPIARVGEFS